jgi:DNA polymerase
MSMHRRTVAQVLAAFDREIGLEATVRAARAEEATAHASAPPTAHTREPATPTRAVASPARAVATAAAPAPATAPAPVGMPKPLTVPPTAAARDAAGGGSPGARLAEIEARHAATCPHCTTATAHTHLVFGEGAPDARLMFIGEAPGEVEDRLGRPFTGPAGEKLDEMIAAMGLRREDTYIANVLKSRPPGNREPLPDEVAACGPFLVEQILAIRPKAIVTLGGSATKMLLGTDTGITRIRGQWQRWTPPEGAACGPIPVMPTYHPAFVLRTYTKEVRAQVWSDLRQVMAELGIEPPVRPGTPTPRS